MAEKNCNRESAYLRNSSRLGDVVAAIQTMGTYKFYKLPFEGWADRISGDASTKDHWKTVFQEHPEFFRLDGEKENASLVWRRQYPKRFQVDQQTTLTTEQYSQLTSEEKARVSRIPLTAADIKALIDTAINLHSRAIEHQRERRWWVALASAGGALVGGVIGGLVKGK
jgi:hypothetical protein